MEFEIDHIIDDIIDTLVSDYKDCSKCGLSKLRSEFHKDKQKKNGLTSQCKGCTAKRTARYRHENKEDIVKRKAIYYQNNKEEICKRGASRYQDNKEEILKKQASYYHKNKEKINERSRSYYLENKEEIAKMNADYYHRNKEAIGKYKLCWKKNRYHTNDGYRIENNLRTRIHNAMNRTKKSERTMKLIGLESGTEMKEYLELLNPELKNVKCDIDHRLPCALYDLKLPEHQKVCFHYTNLQWLIPQVNQSKNDKYPPELKPELDERGKFKRDAPTVLKQLSLIAHIESHKLTFKQVVDLQRAGQLFEVIGIPTSERSCSPAQHPQLPFRPRRTGKGRDKCYH